MGCSQKHFPVEQELRLSQGELGLVLRLGHSQGEQYQRFSQGELGLEFSLGEGPEDHHTRHVTGLLPHPARQVGSQGELGLRQGEGPEDHHNCHVTGLLPHPAKQVSLLEHRLHLSTEEPLCGPCRGAGH